MVTKSNLILGMGETREEISEAMRDLHEAGCDLITITQYLRPSERHLPVDRWVKPQEFVDLAARGRARSASSASCPDRWCVPPTGPAGSTAMR